MALITNGDASRLTTRQAIKNDLQRASVLCSRHHLYTSGQWASTAWLTFKEPDINGKDSRVIQHHRQIGHISRWQSPRSKPTTSTPVSVFKVPFLPGTAISTPSQSTTLEQTSGETDDPLVMLVNAAFAQQKYSEVAALSQSKVECDPLLRFLHYYARYLHIDRMRTLYQDENEVNLVDEAHFSRLYDKLRREVSDRIRKPRLVESDGPLLLLYGKLMRKLKKIDEAIKALMESLSVEPRIVETWTELAECMENRAEIVRVSAALPTHWMQSYFLGRAYGHVGLIDRALASYQTFQSLGFSDNPDLKNAMGKLIMTTDPNTALTYMDAARIFSPARMNDVDSYSHLLFILDDHVRMRILADEILQAGRFNSECSIALGNFYGLLGDHEKSVVNFSKALRYNPDLHHVWTLIGHEQVELKQTELAMRSYSNAIEADPAEYRAWYGLGQTMEILRAHASALYYFKRAFENCPSDSRMLLALADTFQVLENNSDAEMCYWRAYQVDADTVVLVRLGRLFEKLGRYGRAAELYIKYTADVQQEAQDNLGISLADRDDAEDLGHAYLYLSKYYLLHRLFDNAFEEAQAAEIFREVKDEAHSIQKQISRMQAEARDNADDYQHVDPARLGFPLWTEPVVMESAPALSARN